MNKKEARELAEVLEKLEKWSISISDTVIPTNEFTGVRGPEINAADYMRERTRLWRESWILPTLRRLVARYGDKKTKEVTTWDR